MALIRSGLGTYAPKPLPAKALAAKTVGLSFAEIRRSVDESIKEVVMHEGGRVDAEALGRALLERRRLSEKLEKNNKPVNHAGSSSR
jgi:hypothetical protein